MTKQLTILLRGQAGGENAVRDLEIEPGTTKADILTALNLDGEFEIWRRKTNEQLDDEVDLHVILEDGEKLEASLPAKLG